MHDYLAALIIGIVEGLTEFLPVSSTAHIRLAQELLQLPLEDRYWKMFAIVIQLGAILAVVVYFRSRLLGFLKSYPRGPEGQHTWWSHPLALVAISFVVTAVPCLLMDKFIGENLERLSVMAWALVIGGGLMWWVDWYYSPRASTQRMEQMSLWQAIAIGLSQIFAAAFPGVSRSMATIAGGQMMGLSRPAALEFSFFLSIPVMVAATGYKLLQYLSDAQTGMSSHQWLVLGIGFGVSFAVAWVVIAWFMAWVRRHGFAPFAVYRLVLGGGMLVWLYTR